MLSQQYNNLYQDMIGGTKPNVQILKNINLLSGNMEKYLNPFYGFVWANSAIINNIFLSEKTNRNSTAKIIRSSYFEIPGSLQPIKPLFLNEHNSDMKYDLVTNRDIGKYLGIKYLCIVEKDQWDKWKNCLKVTNDVEERIVKIRDLKLETEKEQNIASKKKVSMIKMMKTLHKCLPGQATFDTYDEIEFLRIVNNVRDIVTTKLQRYNSTFNSAINLYIDAQWEDIKENFYTVLSIMWHKADNKQGIKDYYLGLNDALGNITIPETFVTDKYDLSTFDKSVADYYEQVAYTYTKTQGDFVINNQEYAFVHNGEKPFNYADCGSSALRTFLRLWLTQEDTESYDIQKLIDNDATENLITFFTKFNNDDAQVSKDATEIFGQKLNARDAWIFVVSSLSPEIIYNKTCNLKDGSCLQCELKARIPNIRKTIQTLLPKMDDYKSFEFDKNPDDNNGKDYLFVRDFYYSDTDENFGTVELVSGKHGTFIWTFVDGHTYMDKEIESEVEEFENADPELEFYLYLFSKPIHCILKHHDKFNTIFPYWYKFFSFDDHQNADKLYNKMVNMDKRHYVEYMKLMLNITPELYNKITFLLLFHFKNDSDALQRIALMNGIVTKENLILYFASLFKVIVDKDKNIIALKHHETFVGDVTLDIHNFNLLTKLTELHLNKGIVVPFTDTNNIKKLYVHNFYSIRNINTTLVNELYIDNANKKLRNFGYYDQDEDFEDLYVTYDSDEDFTNLMDKFTRLYSLELGSNCDIETHLLNKMGIFTFKAVTVKGSFAYLPRSLRRIELQRDKRENWSDTINLPRLVTITIHNGKFHNNYYEMMFNLESNNTIDIISNATKTDISEYLFEMQIMQHELIENITMDDYNNDNQEMIISYGEDITMRDEIKVIVKDIENEEERNKKFDELILERLNASMSKKIQKVYEYNTKFNSKIKYSLSHTGYLKALEKLTTYEDKCKLHAEYLHDLFYQIKEYNGMAEIKEIDVSYSYTDDSHAIIQLTIDGKIYNINVDDKTIIVTSDGATFTITDKCKSIDKDKIANMICKMVNIKGIHVFTPNISMAYTDYD